MAGPATSGAPRMSAVSEQFDPVAHNRAEWDREVESGNE